MLHPLRALRRTTGLWLARAVVTELKGVRTELANIHSELLLLRTDNLFRGVHQPVQVTIGQGFVTARPSTEAPGPEFAPAEAQAIEATTEQRYVEYAQIASELQQLFRRTPTTEEIEREHLLRLGN